MWCTSVHIMAYEICRVTFAICGSECGKIVTSTILYKGTCTEISFSLQHDQGEDEVILLMKQLSYKPTSPWWWWVFSSSAVSNSLQPCGLQHVRLPCPSPSSRVCSNSSWWWKESLFHGLQWKKKKKQLVLISWQIEGPKKLYNTRERF